jgi:ribonuclease HI
MFNALKKIWYNLIMDKKNIERFLKKKEINAVSQISASYSSEFKKCYLVVKRYNGELENIILPNTSHGYTKDFNDFIFKYLKDNKLSGNFFLLLDSDLTKNKELSQFCLEGRISYNSFNQRELSKFKTFGKKIIREERISLLKELKDYKNNVMLYTDGSKVEDRCGMACIVKNKRGDDMLSLSSAMLESDSRYTNHEVDAISLGLTYILENKALEGKRVIITTDSDYASEVCLKINKTLEFQLKHKEIYDLLKGVDFNIKVNLIKSHLPKLNNKTNTDFMYNDLADKLASAARIKLDVSEIKRKKKLSY